MAVAKVQSAGYASSAADSQAVLTITTPTNGNLLLVGIGFYPNGGARVVSAPSGWTELNALNNDTAQLNLYYKIANSEGTNPSYTFTVSGGTDFQSAAIYEISGQDTTDPFNFTSATNASSGSPSTTMVCPTVIPKVLSCLAITFCTQDTGGANTDTVSTGWTLDQSKRPSFHALDAASKNALTADLTTGITNTFTMKSSYGATATVLIMPPYSHGSTIPKIPKPRAGKLNWKHPLSTGLVIDIPFWDRSINTSVIDTTGKHIPVPHSEALVNTLYGPAINNVRASSAYINVPFNADFHPTDFMSVEMIVYKSNWRGTEINVGLCGSASGGSNFTIDTNDSYGDSLLEFIIHTGSNYRFIQTPLSTLGEAATHHIIGTFDGTNATLYIDGVQVSQVNGAGAIDQPTSNDLGIGVNMASGSTPGSNFFDGYISLFRMWSHRALTATEVKQLYTNPWQIYAKPSFLQSLNSIVAGTAVKMQSVRGWSWPV